MTQIKKRYDVKKARRAFNLRKKIRSWTTLGEVMKEHPTQVRRFVSYYTRDFIK